MSTDVDTTRVAQRLAELLAQIATLSAEAESLKAELRALPVGTYDAGPVAFKVAPSRRFDPEEALTMLPEELRAMCWKMSIDAVRVREYLAPALAEQCMHEHGAPRVTFL